MGYSSFLRSPKEEEQEVPDSSVHTKFSDTKAAYGDEEQLHIMDELEGIWGIEDDENLAKDSKKYGQLSWDFMDWEEFPKGEGEEQEKKVLESANQCFFEEASYYMSNSIKVAVKRENIGSFWDDDDDDEKIPTSLNLNLNYEQVLDAWSNRGSPWADGDGDVYSLSMPSNGYYMGEVPVMEEERTRREARVLRYKEKRQTRLFSKKIRYQVRKLNADKRPRLKGRFVKRVS
ncbi:zinc finger protein CONSTANS-LIKE 7 isoform X2 [Corylus avellana]|uniref:zinc finger protein CONSTANS-LIKE 7 isoform X2 n=1 Tax=Corylus avellana TaxID=13451 RepID=UPI001E235D8B|nr:zinc finger protein CONSTANS-LIKE 7 isoform X2 [Corylus avellana]